VKEDSAPLAPVPPSPALSRFAKAVVLATFTLLFLGGLVTSWKAGMAVPDWPLSFGSLNPDGWWADLPVRLEHGHRLFAMLVGLLVGILCAWVWGNWKALGWAALAALLVPGVAQLLGASKLTVMHLRIWPAAAAFLLALAVSARGRAPRTPQVRWLAVAAFIGVCVQAMLGGLRVTRETAGAVDVALVLRIVHGVFAQLVLCLLVAIAAMLSSKWSALRPRRSIGEGTRWLAWIAVGAVFAQLIAGAMMRHLDAGLAIPTFPAAAPDGGLLPPVHNLYTATNFAHTRVGSVVVTVLICLLAAAVLRVGRGEPSLRRPAWALLALVAIQFTLGVLVIWHLKPRTLTTVHVVNGAVVLAVGVLLAMRLARFSPASLAAGAASPAAPPDVPLTASSSV
jgi:heme a synthase